MTRTRRSCSRRMAAPVPRPGPVPKPIRSTYHANGANRQPSRCARPEVRQLPAAELRSEAGPCRRPPGASSPPDGDPRLHVAASNIRPEPRRDHPRRCHRRRTRPSRNSLSDGLLGTGAGVEFDEQLPRGGERRCDFSSSTPPSGTEVPSSATTFPSRWKTDRRREAGQPDHPDHRGAGGRTADPRCAGGRCTIEAAAPRNVPGPHGLGGLPSDVLLLGLPKLRSSSSQAARGAVQRGRGALRPPRGAAMRSPPRRPLRSMLTPAQPSGRADGRVGLPSSGRCATSTIKSYCSKRGAPEARLGSRRARSARPGCPCSRGQGHCRQRPPWSELRPGHRRQPLQRHVAERLLPAQDPQRREAVALPMAARESPACARTAATCRRRRLPPRGASAPGTGDHDLERLGAGLRSGTRPRRCRSPTPWRPSPRPRRSTAVLEGDERPHRRHRALEQLLLLEGCPPAHGAHVPHRSLRTQLSRGERDAPRSRRVRWSSRTAPRNQDHARSVSFSRGLAQAITLTTDLLIRTR